MGRYLPNAISLALFGREFRMLALPSLLLVIDLMPSEASTQDVIEISGGTDHVLLILLMLYSDQH